MPNILKVTLVELNSTKVVDIDQGNHANEVHRSDKKQTITWKLEGNAASGEFLPTPPKHGSDEEAGFTWIEQMNPDHPNPFDVPTPSRNGKDMTMSETNDSEDTHGNWYYMLRIKVGETTYSTISRTTTSTHTDPCIMNK